MGEELQRRDSLVSVTVCSYSALVELLIDEVAQDVHRAVQTDTLHWICVPEDMCGPPEGGAGHPEPSEPTAVQFPGRGDADGPGLEQVECQHCGRKLAATRYAPHLEKCLLGKGRNARGSRKINYTE